jgi:AraC-like DNA-binding protein
VSSLVRGASLTGFPELARASGLDPHQLLAAVNLPAACLETPEMMIPAGAVGRLLELAANASRIESFGLRLAETRRLSNLGAIALVAREEPTGRRAIEAVARYMRLINSGAVLRLDQADDTATIRIVATGRRPSQGRQATELNVGVAFNLLKSLLGPGWRPQEVCFMHHPPHSLALHQKVFGIRPAFGKDFNGIVCEADDLDRLRPGSDAALTHAVRRHLDERLASQVGTLTDKVRETVAVMLPLGDHSLDRVATQLGLEPRTMQRRLADDGKRFSELVDQVRGGLALQYLADQQRPLDNVAMLLGFSELSAFSRWFKATFGRNASAYRKLSRNLQ